MNINELILRSHDMTPEDPYHPKYLFATRSTSNITGMKRDVHLIYIHPGTAQDSLRCEFRELGGSLELLGREGHGQQNAKRTR